MDSSMQKALEEIREKLEDINKIIAAHDLQDRAIISNTIAFWHSDPEDGLMAMGSYHAGSDEEFDEVTGFAMDAWEQQNNSDDEGFIDYWINRGGDNGIN